MAVGAVYTTTIEAIDVIKSAAPDRNSDTAVVTLSREIPVYVIKAAIEDKDYKFIGAE